ncbi:LysR family transcriptional regulator [Streptomyces sp. NPDC056948]|uniref:LysR family transcriptional regulator n=1 Tax=Streptomyces sp. NPDC056948 TaxID=3345975 RepID=UPI00362F7410
MDIEALRTFVAAAEAGQFQAAADELRISQQAVSKRIMSLEKNLEVVLLCAPLAARLSLDGQGPPAARQEDPGRARTGRTGRAPPPHPAARRPPPRTR